MRVLVTGARGFVGRHAVQALTERGHEVQTVVHHPGDPPDIGAVRPDAALHLAWHGGPGRLTDRAGNEQALADSLALMDQLRDSGCRRIVLAGTCIEQPADSAAGQLPYAECKRTLHTAVVGDAGWSATCAHIFGVFGPGENPGRAVPRIVRALLAGEPCDVSAGSQLRDVLHVHDVASALATLVEQETASSVDICSGTPLPLRDVFREIEAATGTEGLIRYGAAELHEHELFDTHGDAAAIRATGWTPVYDLPAAVAQTVAWWRA